MLNLEEYLRIADAAKHLGVCKNTLRNWGGSGKLTEYRHPVNNYRLYKRADLDELLERIEQPNTKFKPR